MAQMGGAVVPTSIEDAVVGACRPRHAATFAISRDSEMLVALATGKLTGTMAYEPPVATDMANAGRCV